ncbi:transporter substrate-binding domain-containing protein [Shewanella sp. C32]|uniref:Transporter substrate-binding domain-containing protein n=1 Tax=Shewanella electrica TaxID=515560 RepID=A0ABT2FH06_9GAMM|nr:transporter substrate-binding domain-containing protein [Shewanella electrica]MCH1923506.1 transporter substrate-binding domain-containing protein [Shewanella electrica]MCS4555603.1 transporter substrate-binding domain-containing protein [Shewanella electrica]
MLKLSIHHGGDVMKLRWIIWLTLLGWSWQLSADELVVLKADFRPRPPEMRYGNTPQSFAGPLVVILERACERAGCKIEWQDKPFPRSMRDLSLGRIHIVPRLIFNQQRREIAQYIGPIAIKAKPIMFIGHLGKDIMHEEQLLEQRIGVKLGTYYSDFINYDNRLTRVAAADDANLAKMFAAGRFDYLAVLDKRSAEAAFKEIGFSDYHYTSFAFPNRMPIYYGFSKAADHQEFVGKLQYQLEMMITQGEIEAIYQQDNEYPTAKTSVILPADMLGN